MTEWLKVHAWKACVRCKSYRGFESLSLRQIKMDPLWVRFCLAGVMRVRALWVRRASTAREGRRHAVLAVPGHARDGRSPLGDPDTIPLAGNWHPTRSLAFKAWPANKVETPRDQTDRRSGSGHGSSDAAYAASATKSATERFATAACISGDQRPFRTPVCRSYSCRTR